MSEFPRLRASETAVARPPSSGGPHFPVTASYGVELAAADDPVAPPAATARAPVELSAVALTKNYRKGPVEIPVLRGVDLEVRSGEFLSIIGQSGSGKSTLLHLLGTLDAPTPAKCISTASGSTICPPPSAIGCGTSCSA